AGALLAAIAGILSWTTILLSERFSLAPCYRRLPSTWLLMAQSTFEVASLTRSRGNRREPPSILGPATAIGAQCPELPLGFYPQQPSTARAPSGTRTHNLHHGFWWRLPHP